MQIDNESVKKLLVMLLGGGLIFWFCKPKLTATGTDESLAFGDKKSKYIKKPILNEEALQDETLATAYDALCAYIDAHNEGESEANMEELNDEIRRQVGMEVYKDGNGKLAVRDLDGNPVLENE